MEEISLIELFDILKKRIKMIIGLGLLGLLLAIGFTFFIANKRYSSTTQILVNHNQSENVIQQSDISANIQLINTYTDIIKGPVILDEVRESLDLNMSHNELAERIEISNEDNSQVFSVRVTDGNPFRAETIVNTTANTFQEKIDDIMNVDNVTIISEAVANTNPVSPNPTLNLAIGTFLGLVIGVGLAFLLEFLDDTVKDGKFITEELGWTNLGNISEMSADELQSDEPISPRTLEETSARSRV